jgi:hypothetical protein
MQQASLLPGARLDRCTGIELVHVQPGGSVKISGSFMAPHFPIDSNGNMDIARGG